MASPKLRFKEFDGDWTLQNLSDSFSLISGYAFPSSASTDSGAKWLKIADVGIQEMTPNNPSYLPLEYLDKYSQFVVNKDDYVIALTRPILNKKLKIAKIGNFYDGALLNQRVAKISSRSNNLDFIYSLLQKSKTVEELENSIAGTDPPNLSLNDVKEIKLGFPSKEEQTKIASFISAVDEKIGQLKQKHELLSQYKQGMMQKLFSQQIRFKADDGSEFGEWEIKLIKDIADVKGGKRLPKGYSLINENTGHPYITVGDMNRSYSIDNANIRYVPLEVVDIIKRYTITDKEIFISVAGTLGIIGKIPTELNGANLTENADKLTNLKCHQNFLIYLLDSGYLAELIESTATTSAQPKLALYAIEQMEIQVPCLEEQTKIADFLSAIDQKIETVAQQIEQAKQWKKGLLQQMFV